MKQTIKETILSAYPTHDFLGEEDVPAGAEASAAAIEEKLMNSSKDSYLWIVDPIDGTVSFISFVGKTTMPRVFISNIINAMDFDYGNHSPTLSMVCPLTYHRLP